MTLLTLGGLIFILTKCLEAQENRKRLTMIVDNGHVPSKRFTAYLPEGYVELVHNFSGYFVELDDSYGCKSDISIIGQQDTDAENKNNFIPYIQWTSYPGPCSFRNMTENLRSIKINHFVFIMPELSREENENFAKIDEVYFVLMYPDTDVDNFKSLVSTNGSLSRIEVDVHKEAETSNTIPMSSMAILFVTVAFVTLMTVSIGWLVFYYAQRCRQRNMRERMQSRLCVAAKRAVSKLPTKTVPDLPKTSKKVKKTVPQTPDNASTCSSVSSNEDADFCPVCLDLYKPREVIRILPCKHEFHKNCVDPWLFDHRTCPMCKLDILEHLGMPSGGDRLDTPVVQPPAPPTEPTENVSGRVDQEVQTDFVNPPSPQQQQVTSVVVRLSADDEIEPAPISPPAV